MIVASSIPANRPTCSGCSRCRPDLYPVVMVEGTAILGQLAIAGDCLSVSAANDYTWPVVPESSGRDD